MECNHKDFKGNLDLRISDLDIYCRKCNINFGKITMPVEWFDSSKYREGEIEIKQEFSFFLGLFKKEFEDYDVTILQYEQPKPLSNSDKRHFELISETNQLIKEVENTMENKGQCNHNHLVVVTEGIQCHDCSHLLTVDIKDIHYWVFYNTAKKRDIMREYPSLTFREFSNYDLEEKKDINIINNQAQKIASLQAENERLNKIVVGLSEMFINKTVGKSNNNTNILLDIQTGGRE